MIENEMNVAISVNEKYVRYAYVMLSSLFKNHSFIKICVYILYSDISENSVRMLYRLGDEYGQKICAVYIGRDVFPKQLPCNNEWPIEIYYRLALGEMLPEKIKRIIYLDVDVIIIDSIWDFYNVDFGGRALSACPDMSALDGLCGKQKELFKDLIDIPEFQYFNSGVLLINLEKVRKDFCLEQFCNLALELPLTSPDQDLLNYIFYKDVVLQDEKRFNLFAKKAYQAGYGYNWIKDHTAIVHYTGFKPWAYNALHYEVEKFWWEYAKKTPFYTEFLEEIVLNEVETSFMDRLVRQMEEEKSRLLDALTKCTEMLKMIGEKGKG